MKTTLKLMIGSELPRFSAFAPILDKASAAALFASVTWLTSEVNCKINPGIRSVEDIVNQSRILEGCMSKACG